MQKGKTEQSSVAAATAAAGTPKSSQHGKQTDKVLNRANRLFHSSNQRAEKRSEVPKEQILEENLRLMKNFSSDKLLDFKLGCGVSLSKPNRFAQQPALQNQTSQDRQNSPFRGGVSADPVSRFVKETTPTPLGRSIPKIFKALPEALLAEFIFPDSRSNQRGKRNGVTQRSSTRVNSRDFLIPNQNKSVKRQQMSTFQNAHPHLLHGTNQATSSKWKDLGEEHIVRAASVYTNIPLNKPKQLNAVLKKAHEKTLVQLSARSKQQNQNQTTDSHQSAVSKKEIKRQIRAVGPQSGVLAQRNTVSPPGSVEHISKKGGMTPREQKAFHVSKVSAPAESSQHELAAQNKSTGYDSKLSKSNANNYKSSGASGLAPSRQSNIHFPQDLAVIPKKQLKEESKAESEVHNSTVRPSPSHDYVDQQNLAPTCSQLAQVDHDEVMMTAGDPKACQNNGTEYSLANQASCTAYYGQHSNEESSEAYSKPTSQGNLLREQPQEGKQRNTAASHGARRDYTNRDEAGDENLNFRSPTAIGSTKDKFNSKSSKHGASKTQRRKQTQRLPKHQQNNQKKTMKKRIGELGSVYEQRNVVVPGAQAGSIMRTSTQDLRSVNGFGSTVSNPSQNGIREQAIRRADEITKKRMMSQSPKLAYECSTKKANPLVPTKAQKEFIKLQNTHDKRHSMIRGCEAALMCREDEEVARQRKNLSLSCRSEKSSLPEIGNRSMHDQSMIEGVAADDQNPGSRQFYPAQLIEQLASSQGNVTASLRNGARGYGQKENSEIHLYDLNNSDENLVSLNSSAFVDQRVMQGPDVTLGSIQESQLPKSFNLPNIQKQSATAALTTENEAKDGGGGQSNTAGLIQKVSANVEATKLKSAGPGIRPIGKTFASRTQSIGRANSTKLHEVSKNSKTGSIKRESTRQQILQPIQISEVPASKESISAERTGSLEKLGRKTSIDDQQNSALTANNQRKQSGPSKSGLKPLNHTPLPGRGQAKDLITAQKTSANDQFQQVSAKTAVDFRKANQTIGKQKRRSVLEECTLEQLKVGSDLDGAIAQCTLMSPNKPAGDDDDSKSKAMTTAAKDAKILTRSPLRGTSIDRNIQGGTLNRFTSKESQFATIYAQSINAEPFYRRAIRRLGWREVPQNESILKSGFHVRLTISDLEGSSKDLQKGHFYNHFPQNRELVTKMGLCKNLWFNCFSEQEQRVSHMFPRCYDLSVPQQSETFIQDFNQTAILSIIKIMATSFMNRNKDMQKLLDTYAQIHEFKEPERFFKPNFKKQCLQIDMRSSARGNLLGISEVFDAYSYCKSFCNQLLFKERKKNRRFGRASQMRFNESQIQNMVGYQALLVDQGVPQAGFATYEQFKIVRLHKNLEQLLPQYRQIDGTHNIWIVKPSYNARGVGIYCTRQLREILRDTEKAQQKVVQKYIERPFCLDGQKKFDFRQWVLVNNWEPLDVCVFESAYLKVCGSPFDLKQVSDVYRHLSNYSLQKENGGRGELVMSSREFEEFMRVKTENPDFTWQNNMLPKINDVVWRTLKGVQENFEQKPNSFEVYGFDIVLDQDLNLWVIEVNLSPACSERTAWLTQMLNDSCTDLLRHIQSRILTVNPAEGWTAEMLALREQAFSAPHKTTKSLNPKSFYEQYEIKDRWIRLPESIQEIKEFSVNQALAPQKGVQLEMCGEKADLRFERRMDRQYRTENSAIEIQRLYRGYLGRKISLARLQLKYAIIIQKNARVLLAKCELDRLRQERAAKIVQKQLRRILAQRLAKKLDQERILALKTRLVTKVQAWYRAVKAKAYVQQVRRDQATSRCQRHLRGYMARLKALKERTRLCMTVRIQLFYKRRHKLRHGSAALLQKLLKKRLAQKRVSRMYKITKASKKLTHLIMAQWQKRSVKKWRCHCAAIHIQSFFKMVMARSRFRKVLQLDAQKRFKMLCRMHVLKQMFMFARMLKIQRDLGAITIQKRLRVVLASKRAKEMRHAAMLAQKAVIIQRQLKGYLGMKEAKRRRIKIGATIMIQSLVRGFLTRRREMRRKLQKVKAQLQDQQPRANNTSKLEAHNSAAKKLKSQQRNSGKNHHSTRVRANVDSRVGCTVSTVTNNMQEDRTVRYQSNPPKFARKAKGLAPSGAPGRKQLNTNASQNSLVRSHQSLRRSDENIPLLQSSKHQFVSNQSGSKKRKYVAKKSAKEKSSKGSAMQDYHYDMGMRQILNQQSGLQDKVAKAQRSAHQEAILAKASAKERRYALQNVKVQQESQQRLGTRIAQNLQHQKVGELMDAGTSSMWNNSSKAGAQARSNLPGVRTQYGGESSQVASPTTMDDKDITLNATQQVLGLPQVDLAYDVSSKQQNQITIEARKSKEFSPGQPQSTMTPTMKGSSNFAGASQSGQNSQTKLPTTKRSGIWNLPAMPLRSSLEATTILEAEKKIVARGLGKDQDVTAMQTTLDMSRSGRGQGTTIVMRKDPSRSSLNSGRESKNSKHGRTQYKQQQQQSVALSSQIDTDKLINQELSKQVKVKSKQLKNLERLVKKGAPYMESHQRQFLHNRANGQQTNIKERIAEQQRQLTQAGLQALKNCASASAPRQQSNHQQKSFAKYLGEMLKSQVRDETAHAAAVAQVEAQQVPAQNFDSIPKSSGAFSSNGKGSLTGIRIHQPDFKPIKNKAVANNAAINHVASPAIVATTSLQAYGLPEVVMQTASSNQSRTSRNDLVASLKSSKGGTHTTFVSRADDHLVTMLRSGDAQNMTHTSDMVINDECVLAMAVKSHDGKNQEGIGASTARAEAMRMMGSRRPSKKNYSQAQQAFNKTKDGYLDQIKKDQERRYQAITDAHKMSQMLLASSNGTSLPQSRPDTRDNQHSTRQTDPSEQGAQQTDGRRGSRNLHQKRASKVMNQSNMVVI